ncbi:hypothetical protein LK10_01085 [Sinomonas humi]|uniref:Uncharacterized protein n=1 Tax=Sinomonas humi TaxID=1338436 RepID=A0A0B2ATX3_9MICC|nr:hypothetical protein LK10_01085 [Sinomonas humi]
MANSLELSYSLRGDNAADDWFIAGELPGAVPIGIFHGNSRNELGTIGGERKAATAMRSTGLLEGGGGELAIDTPM